LGKTELYAGFFAGEGAILSAAPYEIIVPLYALMISLSIALVSSNAAAKLFAEEQLIFFREFNSGHSVSAFFAGKNILSVYKVSLLALHFAAFLQYFCQPYSPFQNTYAIIFVWYYGVHSIGMLISMLTKKEDAGMISILIALVFAIFTGFGPNLVGPQAGVISLSYSRWLAEAVYTTEVYPYNEVYRVDTSAGIWGYQLNRFGYDIGIHTYI